MSKNAEESSVCLSHEAWGRLAAMALEDFMPA